MADIQSFTDMDDVIPDDIQVADSKDDSKDDIDSLKFEIEN